MRRAQLTIGITMLLATVACLALADGYVVAQAARNGVRVELGGIATGGGLAGRSFLPVPPSAVRSEILQGTPCAGIRLVGVGRLPSGPVRGVDVTLTLNETGREGRIGLGACPGATIVFDAADGERIELESGEIDVNAIDLRAGTVEVHFQGTAVHEGAPIAVTGDVRLQWRPPGQGT